MMPQLWMLRVAGLVIVALVLYGAYWSIDNAGYERHKTEVAVAQAKADKLATEKLRKLEGVKNENMAEINRLRANNHAIWLRLPDASSVADCAGKNQTSGSGELSESAPSVAEKALNEFARQCGEQAYQCDSIVESCRVLNEALP